MATKTFFCFLFLFAIFGCGRSRPKPPERPTPTPGPVPTRTEPTFRSIQTNLLQPRCIRCHSGANPSAGLDLTSHPSLMRHGHPGHSVIVPGKPEDSLLYTMIASGRMPLGGPELPGEQISAVYSWIKSGASEN